MKKMIKQTIIALCIFLYNVSYSQTIQGKIEYKASFDLTEMKIKLETEKFLDENLRNRMISTMHNSKDLIFTLIFNENESSFFCSSDLTKKIATPNGINLTALFSKAKDIYYSNLNTNEKFRINYNFNKFLITEKLTEWELTNETKVIGKYNCYKATTIRKVEGRNGVMSRPIIAWYTTEIPTPFGLQNLNGLAGLILELNINEKLVFKAINIDLEPKDKIRIDKPTGTKISSEKFTMVIKNERVD